MGFYRCTPPKSRTTLSLVPHLSLLFGSNLSLAFPQKKIFLWPNAMQCSTFALFLFCLLLSYLLSISHPSLYVHCTLSICDCAVGQVHGLDTHKRNYEHFIRGVQLFSFIYCTIMASELILRRNQYSLPLQLQWIHIH